MPLAGIKEKLTYKEQQLDSQPSECQDTMHQLGGMLGNQFCAMRKQSNPYGVSFKIQLLNMKQI